MAASLPAPSPPSSSTRKTDDVGPNVQSPSVGPCETEPQQPRRRVRNSSSAINVVEKVPEESQSHVARQLHHSSAVVTLSSPIGQHIVNVILQLAAIVAAIAFGYFAVQSVQIANRANEEARLANQIAIYAVCNSNANPVRCHMILFQRKRRHESSNDIFISLRNFQISVSESTWTRTSSSQPLRLHSLLLRAQV